MARPDHNSPQTADWTRESLGIRRGGDGGMDVFLFIKKLSKLINLVRNGNL